MNTPQREAQNSTLGMSIREVARELKVGERQARAWVASGAVYSFRVGRRLIVSRASFLKTVNGEPQAASLPIDADRATLRRA